MLEIAPDDRVAAIIRKNDDESRESHRDHDRRRERDSDRERDRERKKRHSENGEESRESHRDHDRRRERDSDQETARHDHSPTKKRKFREQETDDKKRKLRKSDDRHASTLRGAKRPNKHIYFEDSESTNTNSDPAATRSRPVYCYNCGRKDHKGEDCSKSRMDALGGRSRTPPRERQGWARWGTREDLKNHRSPPPPPKSPTKSPSKKRRNEKRAKEREKGIIQYLKKKLTGGKRTASKKMRQSDETNQQKTWHRDGVEVIEIS